MNVIVLAQNKQAARLGKLSCQPHVYPLARVIDQHPRYVALLADTNSARLFVFDLGTFLISKELHQPKLTKTQIEGWSQMRYQRYVDNAYLHHAKEVLEMLDRVVREEAAEHIILAGDEVIIPLLQEHLPVHLEEKVIDIVRLDIRTPEHEVLNETMDVLRTHNLQSDAEKVRRLLDEYRSGGLAVVGLRDTVKALEQGQVDELLLSASSREIRDDVDDFANPFTGSEPTNQNISGEAPHLITAEICAMWLSPCGPRSNPWLLSTSRTASEFRNVARSFFILHVW